MTNTTLSKEKIAEIYYRCQHDIEYFALLFFPHLLNKDIAPFQREIYADLIQHKFYACAAPRGHAKSTIGLIINPMHFALFRKVGDISLLSASETFIINEIIRPIKREFETNEMLLRFFGELKTTKWSETYFVLKNGIAFEASGIGGQLRGGRRGLIGLDDLETNETVESEDQRVKLRNRVNKELMPKLFPEGQMTLFGTIIHPLSYLRNVIDTPNNGWFKKIYRAYPDSIQEKGHELWPEMLPHEELQLRKSRMGSFAFQSEYMNEPVSDETSPIKESQIRVWEKLPAQYNAVIAVDPAYADDATSDYKTAVLILCDSYGNRFLAHYIRTHAPLGEFQEAVINMWLSNRGAITALGIPNAGVEKSFFASFLRKCQDRKLYPPIMELKNSLTTASTGGSIRNKASRIVAALQPLFEQGKYYIGPDHIEAREEILTIGVSRHDDLVDCMAYAENLIMPFYGELTTNSSGNNVALEVGASADYGYGNGMGRQEVVDITIG